MAVAHSSLGASAHNIANLSTTGFRREVVSQESAPGGGVESKVNLTAAPGSTMEEDMVGLLCAKNSFLANLAVFKTADSMAGALFNIVT